MVLSTSKHARRRSSIPGLRLAPLEHLRAEESRSSSASSSSSLRRGQAQAVVDLGLGRCCGLQDLNDDILVSIVRHLAARSFLHLGASSRRFYTLTCDDQAWRKMYANRWGARAITPGGGAWKERYRARTEVYSLRKLLRDRHFRARMLQRQFQAAARMAPSTCGDVGGGGAEGLEDALDISLLRRGKYSSWAAGSGATAVVSRALPALLCAVGVLGTSAPARLEDSTALHPAQGAALGFLHRVFETAARSHDDPTAAAAAAAAATSAGSSRCKPLRGTLCEAAQWNTNQWLGALAQAIAAGTAGAVHRSSPAPNPTRTPTPLSCDFAGHEGDEMTADAHQLDFERLAGWARGMSCSDLFGVLWHVGGFAVRGWAHTVPTGSSTEAGGRHTRVVSPAALVPAGSGALLPPQPAPRRGAAAAAAHGRGGRVPTALRLRTSPSPSPPPSTTPTPRAVGGTGRRRRPERPPSDAPAGPPAAVAMAVEMAGADQGLTPTPPPTTGTIRLRRRRVAAAAAAGAGAGAAGPPLHKIEQRQLMTILHLHKLGRGEPTYYQLGGRRHAMVPAAALPGSRRRDDAIGGAGAGSRHPGGRGGGAEAVIACVIERSIEDEVQAQWPSAPTSPHARAISLDEAHCWLWVGWGA
jgi:hypothetical protein